MLLELGVLERELSETEMAMLMMVNVSMNASMMAGADPKIVFDHLSAHKQNFERHGKHKAATMVSAMMKLVSRAGGLDGGSDDQKRSDNEHNWRPN